MRAFDRRLFLKGAGAAFLAGLSPRAADAATSGDVILASACQFPGGGHGAVLFTQSGQILRRVDLPDRGHDVVFSPSGALAVAFARRPGNFALAFPVSGSREPVAFHAPEGRHFFGHGAFSPDGRLLYATENDFAAARGMIGIYDATAGMARIGEFESRGIGPHELLFLADGVTLAICNGGIETHPDKGRAMLNLATMRPNITFIDRRDGSLKARLELPEMFHQLSLRHMAALPDGTVIFGGQYEGPKGGHPPLAGRAHAQEGISLYAMDERLAASLGNYVGSVALSRDGGEVAVSSPRGNRIAVLDVRDGALLDAYAMKDGCGLAWLETGLVASNGAGDFGDPERPHPLAVSFDNHLAVNG
ncbi:MAG: DUF1513 domain-containing protein [Notoacmeibacter sp.]|nr:DUF1513 domain-containing protein [Notoacmeibacter sp.]MCC0032828.1 DUF1513 domain-containing protein [Brucellaceae bacterium]